MGDPIDEFASSTRRRQAWGLLWTGLVLVMIGGACTALLLVPWSHRYVGQQSRLEIVGPFLLIVGAPVLLYGLALLLGKPG